MTRAKEGKGSTYKKTNQANPAKQTKVRAKKVDPLEPLKLEIAAELGLLDQAKTLGWHSLSAREAGRIGGLMTQRRRKQAKGISGADRPMDI